MLIGDLLEFSVSARSVIFVVGSLLHDRMRQSMMALRLC